MKARLFYEPFERLLGFGLRWQAKRDTALGEVPEYSRAHQTPKAPSPLCFAGAVQNGSWFECAFQVLIGASCLPL
jgi:hypothetical protein